MNRVFLVGCSRSGTSVVQSLLASHPDVQSFPESDYFTRLHRYTRRRHLHRVGIATGRERAYLGEWLHTIDQPSLASELPRQPVRLAPAVRSFVDSLDQMTDQAGRSVWIEKTPLHLLHLDLIERYVPEATILHLVRDGREVVASLYDRACKHEHQYKHQKDIDVCISLWNQCVAETRYNMEKKNNHVMLYERAAAQPLAFANQAGAVLGLRYTQEHLDARQDQAQNYVLRSETWKKGISRPIQVQPSKFEILFSDEQKRYIQDRLDMSRYDAVAAAALS